MDDIEVKKASLDDLQIIQNLAVSFFQEEATRNAAVNVQWPRLSQGEKHFTAMIADNDKLCLLAILEGKTVGYLTGKILDLEGSSIENQVKMENIFIERKYRNRHIGSKLVEEFLNWAKEQNANKAFVEAYTANIKAIKFYEQRGFSSHSTTLKFVIE